jgi:hypothetical protein
MLSAEFIFLLSITIQRWSERSSILLYSNNRNSATKTPTIYNCNWFNYSIISTLNYTIYLLHHLTPLFFISMNFSLIHQVAYSISSEIRGGEERNIRSIHKSIYIINIAFFCIKNRFFFYLFTYSYTKKTKIHKVNFTLKCSNLTF